MKRSSVDTSRKPESRKKHHGLDGQKTTPGGPSRSSSFSQMLSNQTEKPARLLTRPKQSTFQPRSASSVRVSSWIRSHAHGGHQRDLSVSPFGSLSPNHLVQALTRVADERAQKKKKKNLDEILKKISSSLRRPVQGFRSSRRDDEVNPGVYSDSRFPNCRIVRHRFSFQDRQFMSGARRIPSRFNTVILIDGSAYWNTSYFSQAIENAKSMLQDCDHLTWQFIVMNHPCWPRSNIPSIHRSVQKELTDIVSNREALHIGSLFLLGYSAGANIAIKEAARTDELADAFTGIYAVSPVPDLTSKSIAGIDKTMRDTKARYNHYTRSAKDVRVSETFMDFVKFVVSSDLSDEFKKCELTKQQADRVREKLRFILPPKDTERANGDMFMRKHGFSLMPIPHAERVWVQGRRDHAAFWVNSKLRKAILDHMKNELTLNRVSKLGLAQQFAQRGVFATSHGSSSSVSVRSSEGINGDGSKKSSIEESKEPPVSTPQLAF